LRALPIADALRLEAALALFAGLVAALPFPVAAAAQSLAPRLLSPADVEAHAQRPVFSPRGDFVAYEVSVSGQRKDQVVVPVAGGKPIALAPSGGGGSRFGGAAEWVCHEATWDPSGKPRLVMACGERGVGNYDLYVAELFGERATVSRLTTDEANEGGPAWGLLRGADLLVFTSAKSGNGDLYRLDLGLDGAVPIRLSKSPATEDFVAFAPAMDVLAFVQRTSRAGGEGVYRMRIDSPGDAAKVADWPGSDETNPAFSPDGRRLAFYSNRGHRAKGADDAYDLYVVEDGAVEPRLLAKGVRKGDGLGPAWLPDGSALVAALADDRRKDPLATIPLAGGPPVLLKTGTEMNGDVAVAGSPSGGARVAFTAQGREGDRVKRWRRLHVLDLP